MAKRKLKAGPQPGGVLLTHAVNDGPRSMDVLFKVPVRTWTDNEVCRYVAFAFESAAHLAGGFGAVTPRQCLAIATRLRRVGLGPEPHTFISGARVAVRIVPDRIDDGSMDVGDTGRVLACAEGSGKGPVYLVDMGNGRHVQFDAEELEPA